MKGKILSTDNKSFKIPLKTFVMIIFIFYKALKFLRMNDKNLTYILLAVVVIVALAVIYRKEEKSDLHKVHPPVPVPPVAPRSCGKRPRVDSDYRTDPMYKDGYATRRDYCESINDPYWRYWCAAARYI